MTDRSFAMHPPDARLLQGRRALVTGGDSGIGQGACFELAAHGAAVAINYVGSPEQAQAMVGAIEDAGGKGLAVAMDVADESDVRRAFATAGEAFGGIDLPVNNAGVEHPYELLDMPLETWQKVIDVN